QGQERYAMLGPSFIVTSNSDPEWPATTSRRRTQESQTPYETYNICMGYGMTDPSSILQNNNNMMTMASAPSEHGDPLFRNTKNKIVSLSNKNRKLNSARDIWASEKK
ncbi:4760_t:CDS:2, partial [Acaulospora morrowiae]